MVILDADLPELLQGQHAADAHLVEDLLHHVRERRGPQARLAVHGHTEQPAEPQVVLVHEVRQRLQHAFLGRLEASVGQHCSHRLVQELPAGWPAQLRHWLPLAPGER